MHKRLKKIINVLDDVGMFFLNAFCVLVSSYIDIFKSGASVKIDFSLGRILIALILGILVTGIIELRGLIKPENEESVAKVKAGKRKNAWLRVVFSILGGLMWPLFIDRFLKLLGLT